ncbi:MAG: YdcF family protein [Mariprofundus sp.]|nr:YdcF family protein [Mariprofundus sp.]
MLSIIGLVFWRRSWGRAVVLLAMALLWLLATEPVRDQLLNPLELHYPPLSRVELQAIEAGSAVIVVLGGGLYEQAPEYGGRDSLHDHALMRTLYGADLALQSGFPVYVSGGALHPGLGEPEGVVMARMLRRFGVDAKHIHVESKSRTTWENGQYMQQILAAGHHKKLILVTTAWHMVRAVRVFESFGMQVIPAPCNYRVEKQPYDLRSFFPRWNVLADSGDGLHEYLGLLWYFWRHG